MLSVKQKAWPLAQVSSPPLGHLLLWEVRSSPSLYLKDQSRSCSAQSICFSESLPPLWKAKVISSALQRQCQRLSWEADDWQLLLTVLSRTVLLWVVKTQFCLLVRECSVHMNKLVTGRWDWYHLALCGVQKQLDLWNHSRILQSDLGQYCFKQ